MTTNDLTASSHTRAEIAFEVTGCIFASFRNVGIAVFAAAPSLEVVSHLRKVTIDLVRDHGRTSTFYITMANTPLPDAAVRGALQSLTSELAKDLIAVASVIHGDGFWASAIRAFATSVHWMSANKYKQRAFAKSGEAARWLAPLHSEQSLAIDVSDLERELTRLLDRPSLRSLAS